jgi:PadR family transcriptional regulator PadR
MDTQLKKGVLEMCVLFQLQKQDMYGYEIMRLIKDVFPDVYDGSIYTILRRLNNEWYTETYIKDVPSGGPARKYYHITETGVEYSNRIIQEWYKLMERVKMLGV